MTAFAAFDVRGEESADIHVCRLSSSSLDVSFGYVIIAGRRKKNASSKREEASSSSSSLRERRGKKNISRTLT